MSAASSLSAAKPPGFERTVIAARPFSASFGEEHSEYARVTKLSSSGSFRERYCPARKYGKASPSARRNTKVLAFAPSCGITSSITSRW